MDIRGGMDNIWLGRDLSDYQSVQGVYMSEFDTKQAQIFAY